jgi:hypothetical protein
VAHGFRLLMSHGRSRYMVLQPHPLTFMCLILMGFGLWLFCVLDLCCGHTFSYSMNTHEPFVRFDGFLVSFSCGLG